MALTLDYFESVIETKLSEASAGTMRIANKSKTSDYFLFEASPSDMAQAIREAFEATVMKEIAQSEVK